MRKEGGRGTAAGRAATTFQQIAVGAQVALYGHPGCRGVVLHREFRAGESSGSRFKPENLWIGLTVMPQAQ